MKSKLFTVERFLLEYHRIIIPKYQRDFDWGKENISLLLTDIEFSENNYYIGNIIGTNNKENDLILIDGQQRITTIFLVLIYLYKKTCNQVIKNLISSLVCK